MRFPPDLLDALGDLAQREGTSRSELMRRFCERGVEQYVEQQVDDGAVSARLVVVTLLAALDNALGAVAAVNPGLAARLYREASEATAKSATALDGRATRPPRRRTRSAKR